MAVLVVPHIVEVTARGTVQGRPWASVWHIANAESWWTSGAPIESVARDFANNFQDHLVPVMTSTVSLTDFKFMSLHSAEGTTGTIGADTAKPRVGENAGSALPPNVAVLVKKSTASRRGARSGRAYLPGVAEASIDGAGILSGGYLAIMQAAVNDFFAGIDNDASAGGDERHIAVVNRPPAARLPGEDVVQGSSTNVSALTVDSLVATQRRRLRG